MTSLLIFCLKIFDVIFFQSLIRFREFLNGVEDKESTENLSLEKVIELLAVAFVSSADQFKLYIQYCQNYRNSSQLLLEDSYRKNYFNKVQQAHQLNGSLESFVIRPIQRLAKYKQFLDELMACCSEDNKVIRCEIRKASEVIAELLRNSNEAVPLSEKLGPGSKDQNHNADELASNALLLVLFITFCFIFVCIFLKVL